MLRRSISSFLAPALFSLLGSTVLSHAAPPKKEEVIDPSKPVSFYKHIRPIFQAQCNGCHQPAKKKGDYIMTDFAALLKGGEEGNAVVTGKPEESNLLKLIRPNAEGKVEMPQKADPLHESQVALISRWISEGAKDDTPASAKAQWDMEHPPVYGTPPAITSIDYSPDGQFIAVAGYHEVLVHKSDGSGIAARLVGLSERIQKVAWSPDGKKIAVSGGSPARMGELQVWDVEKKKLELSKSETFDTIYGASWSPDGKQIAFGASDNAMRAVDATTGKQTAFLLSHSDWVLDTVWGLGGTFVATAGRDMSVKLTEVATQRFVDNITSITPGALKGGVHVLARHPARNEILIGGTDGVPQIYRMERITKRVIGDNANLIRKFPAMKGRIFGVDFSPDGKRIVAGSSYNASGAVNIYSSEYDSALPDEVKKIVETANHKADTDPTIQAYVTKNVKQLASIQINTGGIYAVSFSPDGKTVAAAGQDGKIRLIHAESGTVAKEFLSVPLVEKKQLAASDVIADDTVRIALDKEDKPEALPAGATIAEMKVEPSQIKLSKPNEYAQMIITAKLADGTLADVTRMAKFSFKGGEILSTSNRGLVRPSDDGQGVLQIAFMGKTADVPVEISGMKQPLKPDYVRDVMPVLSKLGCNMGTCHGAKDGKAGFKLSLRGYDPLFDVPAFSDELASRRANVASPEHSLMLLKASGAVPHEGGQLTVPGELYYETIKAWISQGTHLDLATPKVQRIEIFPKNPVVEKIGAKQQMRIVATYAGGYTKDVTAEAYLDSGNMDVVETDKKALVTTLRRGEAPVLARFEGSYAATTVTVMGDRTGFVWKQPETWNKIDELVAGKWQRMKIEPSGICSDSDFIRRLFIDLTGLPPKPEVVREFLSDSRDSRAKREELISKLIGSPEFVDHWTNKWADMLQVNSKFLGTEGAMGLREWIKKQVADNTPYDRMAHQIITASGSTKDNPAAAYFKVVRTPEELVENTTHLFLATRFNCNKCHDHPFEKWTMDNYYETAAFFSQINLAADPASAGRTIGGSAVEGAKPLYEKVTDKKDGEVIHLRTNAPATVKVPFDTELVSKAATTRREQFASWLTSADNDYFAMSYANRIWGYLTGTGVIEPIDDIRAGNPPSNPELLQYLTNEFIQSGFNVRHLMKIIVSSRTYQLSLATNKWNEDDTVNYSHAKARRLSAETLFDAVYAVTGSTAKIPGVAPGTRAAQLADAQIKLPDGFLTNFGRPARESVCECERSNEVNLGPVMALMSGPTVGDAISDPQNAIAKLTTSTPDDRKLAEEIFMRILNRPPVEKEIQAALGVLSSMDTDNKSLLAAWQAEEEKQKAVIAKAEADRAALIASTKAELDAHVTKNAPDNAKKEAARLASIKAAETTTQNIAKASPPFQSRWESYIDVSTTWVPLDLNVVRAVGVTKLEKQPDGSLLATPLPEGQAQPGNYQLTAKTQLIGITGFKLEVLPDERLPGNGPGLAPDGNFVLGEFTVQQAAIDAKRSKGKAGLLSLKEPKADFSQTNFDVSEALKKGNRDKGWAVSPEGGYRHEATFEPSEPAGAEGGSTFTFQLVQTFQGGKFNLGRFRIWVTTSPLVRFGTAQSVADALKTPMAKRSKEQTAILNEHFLNQYREFQSAKKVLASAKKPLPIDPQKVALEQKHLGAQKPIVIDPKLVQLRRDSALSKDQLVNKRLTAAQDLAWALINSPSFLFNH
jgi:WD40 repeat protein/mono/diheme cytochrome c family protein